MKVFDTFNNFRKKKKKETGNSRNFKDGFHPFTLKTGNKRKMRFNREKIPYIFMKFHNFLNFWVWDRSLLVIMAIPY